MSDYRSYNDQEVRDWWDHNYNKAKEGWAKRDDNDKYKFMQTDHGWGVRKQMEEDGWDQMPSKKDPKNKINSIKDLNRINKWFEQGEDEPEEKPKKKKEIEPYKAPEPTPEYKEAKERANTYRKKLYRGDYLGINKRWEPDVDETDSLGLNKKWEPDESQSEDQQEELEPKQFANYNEDYLDKYKIDLIADYKKRKAQQITQELA